MHFRVLCFLAVLLGVTDSERGHKITVKDGELLFNDQQVWLDVNPPWTSDTTSQL